MRYELAFNAIDASYMARHPDLTYFMREQVIQQWMEVGAHASVKRNATYVAMNVLDRYLSACDPGLQPGEFHLIALICYGIGVKYDDRERLIGRGHMGRLMGKPIARSTAEDLEFKILAKLHWRMPWCTVYTFTAFYAHAAEATKEERFWIMLLLDHLMAKPQALTLRPSVLARSIVNVQKGICTGMTPPVATTMAWVRSMIPSTTVVYRGEDACDQQWFALTSPLVSK